MGGNSDGQRELLRLKVGNSETEACWSEFIFHRKERGLDGVNLVISDAHRELTKGTRRQLQGCAGSVAARGSTHPSSRQR
jgi:transposase-like protein